MTPTSNATRENAINAYITGICGFAGTWLAAELQAAGYTVRGCARPTDDDTNLKAACRRLTVDRFDILDADACRTYLVKARPDYVFHLAAIASVGQSFSMAAATFRVNVAGTQNVYDALRDRTWLKKIVLVSSSDVYGPVKSHDLPLKPSQPFNPISPYARSKVAAEFLSQTYIDQYDLPIVIARAFNHTGPGQEPNYVIPSFCRKIVAAERSGGKKPVLVGNLNVSRDLADVRDMVRGYRMLAESGTAGRVYHLCSGKVFKIKDLLNKLCSFSDIKISVKRDPKLMRTSDIPILRGSYLATAREVGWKPAITIDTTLADTLAYWRNHL